MGAVEFGKLVSRRMNELGMSQRRLASRLGELSDGSLFDSTSIRTLKKGQRRLTHELVARLIEILHMDPGEAWAASGLLPPGVSAEELRQLQSFRERHLTAVGAAASALTDVGMPARKLSPGKLATIGQGRVLPLRAHPLPLRRSA
jgi:transcriptional regulator with XRE-family HTH domain